MAKSLVTWEGRSVSQLDDALFLRKGMWEENLKLLSNVSNSLSFTGLTTKELYAWQPKETHIAQGFSSIKNQKQAQASEAYIHWLQIGAVTGVALAFFKAMQFNFNCLSEYSERDCRILYGAALSQPATFAQAAYAAVLWSLAGWLLNQLGNYGLRGFIKERQLAQDLFSVYKTTAESARSAFWSAVDGKDEAGARKIYEQARIIKDLSDHYKNLTTLHLGVSPADYEKMIRPFQVFLEELLSQDIDFLFLNSEGLKTLEAWVEKASAEEQKVMEAWIKEAGEGYVKRKVIKFLNDQSLQGDTDPNRSLGSFIKQLKDETMTSLKGKTSDG